MVFELRNYYAITPLKRPYVLESELKKRYTPQYANNTYSNNKTTSSSPSSSHLPTQQLKGTILLSSEGINVAICGAPPLLDEIESFFVKQAIPLRGHITTQLRNEILPFKKLKIKTTQEVVALKVPLDLSRCASLPHVAPQDWNQLITDPRTLVIDSRNNYEYVLGHFKGAINPLTSSFREFPLFVDHMLDTYLEGKTNIALYCTGGIRCEKSSLFLALHKKSRTRDIYQLDGGILAYLNTIPTRQSLWQGLCFVFDDRATIDSQFIQRPITMQDQALQGYQAKKLSRYTIQSQHYHYGHIHH